MNRKYNIAIAGATGNVGREILSILDERDFPIDNLYLLASSRSKGQKINFKDQELIVEDLSEFDFTKAQISLFSPGGSVSAEFAPKAAAAGCIVIDNTSYFRMKDDVPLIVPEVNADVLEEFFDENNRSNIIANPNCSTIQMVVALKPLHDAAIINRVVVSTYQAASGAGKDAMDELFDQTKDIYVNKNGFIQGHSEVAVTSYGYDLVLIGYEIDEGNGNGILEVGELADIYPVFKNIGNSNLDISGTLEFSTNPMLYTYHILVIIAGIIIIGFSAGFSRKKLR